MTILNIDQMLALTLTLKYLMNIFNGDYLKTGLNYHLHPILIFFLFSVTMINLKTDRVKYIYTYVKTFSVTLTLEQWKVVEKWHLEV